MQKVRRTLRLWNKLHAQIPTVNCTRILNYQQCNEPLSKKSFRIMLFRRRHVNILVWTIQKPVFLHKPQCVRFDIEEQEFEIFEVHHGSQRVFGIRDLR